MELKRIDELKGGEILAKPIMTWDYQIMLPEGAKLKKEYIDKIIELGIFYVYVKEEKMEEGEMVILRSEIEENIKSKVRDILERHTYHHNQELEELSLETDRIISSILEEDQVVEKVFDIKERSSDLYEHSISVCTFAKRNSYRCCTRRRCKNFIKIITDYSFPITNLNATVRYCCFSAWSIVIRNPRISTRSYWNNSVCTCCQSKEHDSDSNDRDFNLLHCLTSIYSLSLR